MRTRGKTSSHGELGTLLPHSLSRHLSCAFTGGVLASGEGCESSSVCVCVLGGRAAGTWVLTTSAAYDELPAPGFSFSHSRNGHTLLRGRLSDKPQRACGKEPAISGISFFCLDFPSLDQNPARHDHLFVTPVGMQIWCATQKPTRQS